MINEKLVNEKINQILKEEYLAIKDKSNNIENQFTFVINKILSAPKHAKVITTGIGKSGFIARKFAATLSSVGTMSFYLNPLDALHGDLGVVHKDDIIFGISQSGEGEEVIKIFKTLKNNYKFSLTGNINSTVSRLSNDHILNQISREACSLNLAPSTSTTLALAITDSIALSIMHFKNFDEVEFSKSHPLGALGKKLTLTVSDIMVHENGLIPSVDLNEKLKNVISSISHFGMGFIVVVDKTTNHVYGIFTDGDLRRLISDSNFTNYLDLEIKNFMISTFTSIKSDTLVVDALSLMKSSKITCLPIIEQKELIGALNIRLIINSGIV
jgi:arabinose-5-phosphate isomerase